ncbi:MAG: hypothetical protein RL264_3153 [Bacteroidota bacterium]|jgi:outer membrane protein OmpA-like peptidoglycan-associated protein
MKFKICFIIISLIVSSAYSQGINKNSLSFDIGGKDGIRYPGITRTRITQLNSYVLGYRYMLNENFGLSPEVGWEIFKDLRDSIGNAHYVRFSLQTYYNLTNFLRFNEFSDRLGMMAIAGAGYSIGFNPSGVVKTDSTGITLIGDGKIDKMLHGYFGARIMYKLHDRISIHSTISTTFNLRQDRTFDGQRPLGGSGFTGKYYNLTFGLTYYIGRNKSHADWSKSNDSRKLISSELKSELNLMRKSLEDDDKDGVINAVDVSPNTPEGTAVDVKGVPIIKDSVSLGKRLLIEGLDSLKNGDSLFVIQLLNEFSNKYTIQLNMLKNELERDTLHQRSNTRNSDDFDNDGFNNSVDICPYIKGESFGCPDSDKDGIPDFMDACPTDPGVLRNNGCKESANGKVVSQNNSPLEDAGVYDVLFEFDSDQLLPSSKYILDRLVKYMNENKDVKIILAGHTDKIGAKSYNESLSRRRAENCFKYIVSKGVNDSRLLIEFYGSDSAKYNANNNNLNLANRRVSFRLK